MVPERIEREVLIEAPLEVVWTVLTDPEHIGGWFGDSAEIDLRPGGEAVLTWDKYGSALAVVERVEPPHVFSFRWARPLGAAPREGNSTLVEFSLSAEGEGTRLRPRRERLPRARGVGGRKGNVRRREHGRLEAGARRSPGVRGEARPRVGAAMSRRGDEVDEVWAAVADPTRRRLLDVLLAHGEATATTLAGELPVTPASGREAPRGPRPSRPRRGPAAGPRGALRRPSGATRRSHSLDGARRGAVGRAAGGDQAHRRVRGATEPASDWTERRMRCFWTTRLL